MHSFVFATCFKQNFYDVECFVPRAPKNSVLYTIYMIKSKFVYWTLKKISVELPAKIAIRVNVLVFYTEEYIDMIPNPVFCSLIQVVFLNAIFYRL